jgi:gluconolactonase
MISRREVLASAAAAGLATALPAAAAPAYADFKVLATGLLFPEGPVALDNGDVILVEIGRGTLSRVRAGGGVEVVADLGGGPNGAAIGPDGACYVANDGGLTFALKDGRLVYTSVPADYKNGSIQRVDLKTGQFKTLYSEVNGNLLKGPNDLVFDEWGGFWFTDTGKNFARTRDQGGLYWAKTDGSEIREVAYPLLTPNGICLSPDRRIVSYELTGPGTVVMENGAPRMKVVASLGGVQSFDSMAMEADGTLVVATVLAGCLTCIRPDGAVISQVFFPETAVTNIAFGGPGLSTAYVTLSQTQRLVAVPWPRSGLKLLYR